MPLSLRGKAAAAFRSPAYRGGHISRRTRPQDAIRLFVHDVPKIVRSDLTRRFVPTDFTIQRRSGIPL
jgi:hypothetical protein